MDVSDASYRIISELLHARTGQQLTEDRRWRVSSALSGLFRRRGISNVDQLVCLLAEPGNGSLADEVVEALLNNETFFFRDRNMFDLLGDEVLPALAKRRVDTRTLRIWSAGCSTGQEVLTIGMMLHARASQWRGWTIELLGTDISQRAIETARAGRYTQFEVQRGLTVSEMIGHFEESASGWVVDNGLHSQCRFMVHNLLDAPPARGGYDLVLCRNVLLYFGQRTKARAVARLQEGMARDGFLMLGGGETLLRDTDTMQPSSLHPALFENIDAPRVAGHRRRATG